MIPDEAITYQAAARPLFGARVIEATFTLHATMAVTDERLAMANANKCVKAMLKQRLESALLETVTPIRVTSGDEGLLDLLIRQSVMHAPMLNIPLEYSPEIIPLDELFKRREEQ